MQTFHTQLREFETDFSRVQEEIDFNFLDDTDENLDPENMYNSGSSS
jgi:hypothetical protein